MKWAGGHDAAVSKTSLPVRGAWIEMCNLGALAVIRASLPVRGAWIEIPEELYKLTLSRVAPRAGSVD